jgi:hypothetical protein
LLVNECIRHHLRRRLRQAVQSESDEKEMSHARTLARTRARTVTYTLAKATAHEKDAYASNNGGDGTPCRSCPGRSESVPNAGEGFSGIGIAAAGRDAPPHGGCIGPKM